MKKLLVLTACLALGVASTCFGAITHEGRTLKQDAEEGYFIFRYPYFQGETPREKAAVKNVNASIHNLAQSQLENMQKTWANLEEEKAFKSKDVDYVVTYQDPKLVSMNFTCTFAQGEKEALYFKDGWTFDLLEGKAVTWKSLLRAGDEKKVTKYQLLKKLRKGEADEDYVLYWSLDKLDTVSNNYYVGSAGDIHLQYNPGEIGPAKSGVVDIDTGCQIADF